MPEYYHDSLTKWARDYDDIEKVTNDPSVVWE